MPNHENPTLDRDWKLLSAAVFLFAFGFATYNVMFVNYINDVLYLHAFRMGLLESLREIPGLLAVGIAGLLASYTETRVGASCLFFSAIGVAATGTVHSYPGLIAATVFWSIFMHQWFTTSSAIPIALGSGENSGRHLGRMGSVGAAGTVTAFIIISTITHLLHAVIPYQVFFDVAGFFIFLGGLMLLPISAHGTSKNRPRLLYRTEYKTYYWLAFLEGCRRQIFTTFAIFALVNQYHRSVAEIASLMLINAIATLFVAAPVGRLIDRWGEQRSMTLYYIGIALAFTGYAVTSDVNTLKVLYVIDNMLFALGVSLTTYLNRIARKGELTASLSMGQTMNHIAAVVIPVTGGLLWSRFGYHAPFWAGVAAAIASLIITQSVGHGREPIAEPQPN